MIYCPDDKCNRSSQYDLYSFLISQVAILILSQRAPAVDKEKRLLRIIPHDVILQIFNEVREEVIKFGGIFYLSRSKFEGARM
ncbi:hypothetical protein ACFLRN_08640 [Thermoproteota archaeon]